MPQSPAFITTAYPPLGGSKSKLNVHAAGNVSVGAGRLRSILIVAPGTTSGGWTINDCATTGAAAAGNTIFSLAFDATLNVQGTVIVVNWPVTVGITVSAVPGGGSPVMALTYD